MSTPATSTPKPAGRLAREMVDLLWYEPEAVPALRRTEKWKSLLEELEPPKKKPTFDDDDPFELTEPEPEAPEIKEKRDVFGVLVRALPTDAEELPHEMSEAVQDDGTFVPPLVLVSGELFFPFDELETLKATVTAVTPLVAGDKRLKDTLDVVNELLQTPWLGSSTTVAENLTARVKEAFSAGNRMLPASYLDQHTERMLLEQRHFQKRTVFGDLRLRTLLTPERSSAQVPTYLPEPLTKQLPMFQRFRARLLCEVHMQQDQYESHPVALRAVALGRVTPLVGVRR